MPAAMIVLYVIEHRHARHVGAQAANTCPPAMPAAMIAVLIELYVIERSHARHVSARTVKQLPAAMIALYVIERSHARHVGARTVKQLPAGADRAVRHPAPACAVCWCYNPMC